MMANICANYSGVVIDQNLLTTSIAATNSFYFQQFRLPENYQRGVKNGQTRFPGISGFQLLTTIILGEASTASLKYTIEQYNFGTTWSVLAKGTSIGAQSDGERVWLDIVLDQEIPVTAEMVTNIAKLRIGFQVVSGIEKFFYAEPNPLPGFVEATQEDGKTPLKGKGSAPVSFSFRILGLVADSGTDFLSNPYRSVAIHSNAQAPTSNTNSGFWLSAPQPSKFAVVSHYSDLRNFPSTPIYGTVNKLLNPSFEYDFVGKEPFAWQAGSDFKEDDVLPELPTPIPRKIPFLIGGAGFEIIKGKEHEAGFEARQRFLAALNFDIGETQAKLKVINSIEAKRGINCLEVTTASHTKGHFYEPEGAYAQTSVTLSKPITFSIWIKSEIGEFKLVLEIGDLIVGKSEEVVTVNSEWKRFSVTLTPIASGNTIVAIRTPANETIARKFYIDGAMVNLGTKAESYFDGDSIDAQWENQRGRSYSIELIESSLSSESTVIDSIILDPITPGIAFNIYYTNDLTGTKENEPMTEEQWEQKLWVHVPQSFVTSIKTTYVLPEPITAKFIKIEFSHLQSRPYEPGDYQKPTQYKLFPDWVAAPFLAELTLPVFTAKKVGVIYDALELGYKPLIEDLIQRPNSVEIPNVTKLISPPAANRVDPETLRHIETTINTYLRPPAARSNPFTLLGKNAANNANNALSYPVEEEPKFRSNTSIAVSGLDRQAIVLDESTPVMFFWVTCRHEYKELTALFESNRAYFAGIKELAFLRNQYSTVADSPVYIETGTDDANTELSDFNVETSPVENNGIVYGEESIWFAY